MQCATAPGLDCGKNNPLPPPPLTTTTHSPTAEHNLQKIKHAAPYDGKTNVGCLPLRSEINYGNIRFRMTLKQMSGVCLYVRKLIR